LQDVVQKGTGRKAQSLKRSDIAGKTGTTNDQRDAWFTGYHPKLATSVWVGFDQPLSLGRQEYGGKAALPIWIDYMKVALARLPEFHFPVPEGISSIKIDPNTGLRALRNQPNSIFEYFKTENAPEEWNEQNPAPPANMRSESQTLESIF
jgi:penicillin-binding protein 1A